MALFGLIQGFPYLPLATAFYLYAVACVAMAVVVARFLPETNGRTSLQVLESFDQAKLAPVLQMITVAKAIVGRDNEAYVNGDVKPH